jgi:pSer/pThr/pTyr-binding forkhead associated (FHA) protein
MMRPVASRTRSGALRLDENVVPQTQTLVLPQNTVIKIAVVLGSRPGIEYELSRPLMTIGRVGCGADIEIDDPEVSRLHCSIEVRRDAILLQDLRSKNGTYMDGARIFAARLEETSEFQVGTTVLRVKCTAI